MTGSLLLVALLASPLDQLGFSSAGAGMASAVIARPPGASAAFYNPAWAAAGSEWQGFVGYDAATLEMEVNGINQDLDAARALEAGMVWPISLGRYGRLGFSGALSFPDERILRARVVPTDDPRFLMYDNRLQRVNGDAAISYAYDFEELSAGVALGFSVLTGAAGSGTTFFLRKSGEFETAEASVAVELPGEATPIGAAFVHWGEWSFGALVRGPMQFDLALGVTADIRFGPFAGDIVSTVVSNDFYTPTKLAAGAAWERDGWLVQVALELHLWSAAPKMTSEWLSDVAFEGLTIALPESLPADQDFTDSWIPRAGVERTVALGSFELALRGGAWFESTPVASTASPVFLDAHRIGAALGVGLTTGRPFAMFAEPASIDAHLTGLWLLPRTYPSHGATDIRPDLEISGYVVSGGASLTLRF